MIAKLLRRKYINLDNYYFYIIILYFIALAGGHIRLGVAASVIIIFFLLNYFYKNKLVIRSSMDFIVLAYILFNSISFFWFVLDGLPLSVFIREYSNSILPIFFYYYASEDKMYKSKFFRNSRKAIVLLLVIGLILHVYQPLFYRNYLYVNFGVGTNIVLTSAFYQGLFGATSTGSLAVIASWLCIGLIDQTRGHRGKIAYFTMILAAILTYRRSAMFMSLVSLGMFHYYGYFKYKFLKKWYLILEIVFIIIIVDYFFKMNLAFFGAVYERLEMITKAISEREGQWFIGLEHSNILIGSGLGSLSHKALSYTRNIVADGNYFRMFGEIGFIGIFLFISILIGSIVNGIKKTKGTYIEVWIIISIALQAIGSNLFSFQVIVPIFWYSVGRINNLNLKNQ